MITDALRFLLLLGGAGMVLRPNVGGSIRAEAGMEKFWNAYRDYRKKSWPK
jgi:hypothetical protein